MHCQLPWGQGVHNGKDQLPSCPLGKCTSVGAEHTSSSGKASSSGQCCEWHGAVPRPAHLPSHSLTGEAQALSLLIKSHLSSPFCLKNGLQEVESSPQLMVSLDKQ